MRKKECWAIATSKVKETSQENKNKTQQERHDKQSRQRISKRKENKDQKRTQGGVRIRKIRATTGLL